MGAYELMVKYSLNITKNKNTFYKIIYLFHFLKFTSNITAPIITIPVTIE